MNHEHRGAPLRQITKAARQYQRQRPSTAAATPASATLQTTDNGPRILMQNMRNSRKGNTDRADNLADFNPSHSAQIGICAIGPVSGAAA